MSDRKQEIIAKLTAMPTIKQVVDSYSIVTKKALGQNFIFDLNVTTKIVNIAGDVAGKFVIEIGCGAGSLTRPILATNPQKFTIVEMDTTLLPVVQELEYVTGTQIDVINSDALKVDFPTVIKEAGFDKASIIANLPYNVATELLFKWLGDAEFFDRMVLMFQKEVAERIVGKPSTKDYGWLSIKSQMLFECTIEYVLPPTIFFPPPKVDSAVVLLQKRKQSLYDADLVKLEKVCKTAFMHRRKTIRNNLKNLFPNIDGILALVQLEPQIRPEEIPIKTYCALAKLL